MSSFEYIFQTKASYSVSTNTNLSNFLTEVSN